MTNRTMQSLRRLRPLLCPFLLAWQAAGCYSWVAVPDVEPKTYIETERPKHVRIKISESDEQRAVQIKNPEVRADSISGNLLAVVDHRWVRRDGSVSLKAILPQLEVRRYSRGKTGLFVAITVAAVIIPLIVGFANMDISRAR